MDKILILLDLIKQAGQAEDRNSFEFITLNKTNALVPYKQAVFWEKTDFGIKLGNVSGNMSLDKNGPYAQFLKTFIKTRHHDGSHVECLSHDNVSAATNAQWKEHIGAHAMLIYFQTNQDGILGGLWLEREKAFNDGEKAILDELAIGYSQSYALLKMREKASLLSPWKKLKRHQKILTLLAIIICLLPVHLNITAPAEIVAKNPTVITVPFDGVIDEIKVRPGDNVTAAQTLFTMDRTDLEGKIDATNQTLKSAQKNMSRLRRESLSAPEKKVEITRLSSEIAERKIEFEHAQKLLKRSDTKSPINGLAIFSDANEFEGQPVTTGTKIMTIADPAQTELLIKVPVDNMLAVTKNNAVEFFLNVSPLNAYHAEIISIGYQASPDSNSLLTYKIRAKIVDHANASPVRIGWKGTAKIEGQWSILAYSILRRPLIALRNLSGL